MVDDDGLPGKGAGQVEEVGKLRKEVPRIEGEAELAEFGEALAERRDRAGGAGGSAARRAGRRRLRPTRCRSARPGSGRCPPRSPPRAPRAPWPPASGRPSRRSPRRRASCRTGPKHSWRRCRSRTRPRRPASSRRVRLRGTSTGTRETPSRRWCGRRPCRPAARAEDRDHGRAAGRPTDDGGGR